jgi:putative membrane protein
MAHIRPRNKKREHRRAALNAAPIIIDGTAVAERPVTCELAPSVSLRDSLAVQRNALANERTFLAYARTALVFAVAGMALVQFFGPLALQLLGGLFICLGVLTLALGGVRFMRVRRRIRQFAGAGRRNDRKEASAAENGANGRRGPEACNRA